MSRIAEMRRLTEDLLHCHEERVANLAAGRLHVHSALGESHRGLLAHRLSRQEAAAVLRSGLANDTSARRAAVNDTMATFTRVRSVTASGQRAALAEVTANRGYIVRGLCADTRAAMRTLHGVRAGDEARLHAGLRRQRVELAHRVSDLMGGVRRNRAMTATQQERALDRGRAELTNETATFLARVASVRRAMAKTQSENLRSERAALQAEVLAALGGFRADREALAGCLIEVSKVWRSLGAKMLASRACPVAKPESTAERENAPSPSPFPIAAVAEVATPVEDTSGNGYQFPLDNVVFSYLADHPDGVRLVELEQHFGVARIRLAQVLARLTEENKARKDEEAKLYFAT